jgi:hypothetical protein
MARSKFVIYHTALNDDWAFRLENGEGIPILSQEGFPTMEKALDRIKEIKRVVNRYTSISLPDPNFDGGLEK